ncbi:MAG: NADP-dependent malic enzyme [Deltaproteobacteria bacterium]|nr:MAG: NADP-dependent malic enzyme [Deltaproteobacteria bacterium]
MDHKRIRRQDALDYHARGRPGKIEVVPTKPVSTARDLSLAYSPGVAVPCEEIAKDPELSFKYTARGNLVAVISNGTAVLGLGKIGPVAAKPVMEGKGVLFKKFADIDVFDIEVDTTEVDAFCRVVEALEPTFGGINLEDIAAPKCFEIEERLKSTMKIPVFHDDQHGTAIISGAALLNACEIAGKQLDRIKVAVSGAGASAIACSKFYISLGVRPENILMCDSKGVIHTGRTDLDPYKALFARDTEKRTLAEAMEGADVFLGCSVGGVVTPEMVRAMADRPIVFALANPDPEISYPEAKAARSDVIMATGRSDYPNQVNNVLGFPFIFRGALDVRATAINEEMKKAAAFALAELARQEVPESVSRAYGDERFRFGPDYIIPKPFDPRVLLWVAPAVARAAMESGVARVTVDVEAYRNHLQDRISRPHEVMRTVVNKARKRRVRIAFPDGDALKIMQAAEILVDQEICTPILLGDPERVRQVAGEAGLELSGIEIVDHRSDARREAYVAEYYRLRQRHGVLLRDADRALRSRNYYAAMMLQDGSVEGVVTGLTQHYKDAIRPYLEVIRTREGIARAAGCYIMVFKHDLKLLADTTVIPDPSAEELADIAIHTAELARYFDLEPCIAMLSYSNFGTGPGASPAKMREATRIVRERRPDLCVDGEMQVDAAVLPELRAQTYPFSTLRGSANVLVFPNLDAANMGYKLLWRLGGAQVIGPILMGMARPVNILQMNTEVEDIVNLAAITAARAQEEAFPV